MTKEQLQKELDEKIKPGVKPSDLRKLKRSKSVDDIPTPVSSEKQISQLKEQVKFHAKTAANYLTSLQTSQAKVSELEEKLKNKPSSAELDQSLLARHQNLKDWFSQYQQTKQLDQELAENIEEASDELVRQDNLIRDLRTENRSLKRDLQLASRLAESRKVPYPNNESNWDYLQYPLYSLALVLFTLWLTNHLRKQEIK